MVSISSEGDIEQGNATGHDDLEARLAREHTATNVHRPDKGMLRYLEKEISMSELYKAENYVHNKCGFECFYAMYLRYTIHSSTFILDISMIHYFPSIKTVFYLEIYKCLNKRTSWYFLSAVDISQHILSAVCPGPPNPQATCFLEVTIHQAIASIELLL